MIRKIRKKDGKNVMREKERIGTIVKNHNKLLLLWESQLENAGKARKVEKKNKDREQEERVKARRGDSSLSKKRRRGNEQWNAHTVIFK